MLAMWYRLSALTNRPLCKMFVTAVSCLTVPFYFENNRNRGNYRNFGFVKHAKKYHGSQRLHNQKTKSGMVVIGPKVKWNSETLDAQVLMECTLYYNHDCALTSGVPF